MIICGSFNHLQEIFHLGDLHKPCPRKLQAP